MLFDAAMRTSVSTSTLLQVLRYYGYFVESVPQNYSRCVVAVPRPESHRIRRVVVHFYLEDDTIQVTEPKQDNSGIPQVLPCLCQRGFADPNPKP
jgi:EF-hand domain-containing protein 1